MDLADTDLQDALFEDLQALSDDAESKGLTDVALVLEFAMDVYLRDTHAAKAEHATQLTPPLTPRPTSDVDAVKSSFLLAQVYRQAS